MATLARPRPLVLIVEDDEDIAESLKTLLESEEFDALSAADGVLGLERARDARPDVILLDMMLPRLDGVGVAHELRRTDANPPPVVLYSAGWRLEEAAREVGTPWFLRKPFDIDELLALIRRALASRVTAPAT